MKRTRSTKALSHSLRCAVALAAASLLAGCNPFGEATRRGPSARAVAARRALLHRLPQRRRARRRPRFREDRRPRTSRSTPRSSRWPCASCAATRCRRRKSRGPTKSSSCSFVSLARGRARRGRRRERAATRPSSPHRLESQGVRERRARPARARDRRARSSCRRTTERRALRQHRERLAGVAVVHRAVRRCRAADRRARRRPTRRAHGRSDVLAPPGHAARRTSRACRSARAADSLPRTMFPSDGEYEVNIADMFSHIWGNDIGVREHASS